MEIKTINLVYCGVKYDLDDFESFLFENDFKGISPELFLLVTSHILLLYGVVITTWGEKRYPILLKNISNMAAFSLIITLLLFFTNPINHGIFLYHTLILDQLTGFFKMIIIVAVLFSLFMSVHYLERQGLNYFEFILFILFSTSSMLFLLSAQDFISMYLSIELQSLAFYIMAALKRDSEFSTEAGLKYFILGAFSSGLLVFGCSLIYGFTGTVEFAELAKLFSCGWEQPLISTPSWRGCELGIIFLLIGFLFKLTAVPFHMWAPDVYEGAPTAVTAFFAITPKVSLLLVLIRLLYQTFFDYMAEWQALLIFSSLASMLLGSLAGLSQQRIKRLLAYSSIGHVGYLLVALCCGSLEGLQAVTLYLVIYMIMTTNIFAVILAPLRRSLLDGVERIKYTTDFAMLGRINPLLATALTVSMFSLAGIPPLAGFYGKAFLFWAALSSSQYLLAFIGIATSAISCFYYIRLVKIMYFEIPKGWLSFFTFCKEASLILTITLLVIICFMGYPVALYVGSHKVALTLCL
jgi:proton-translocating NADH-quinone oxidoreductase chain N